MGGGEEGKENKREDRFDEEKKRPPLSDQKKKKTKGKTNKVPFSRCSLRPPARRPTEADIQGVDFLDERFAIRSRAHCSILAMFVP